MLDRPVSPQRGWEYLKGLEFRLRQPRPHHQKSSWQEQEQWKDKLAEEKKRFKHNFPTPRFKYGQKMNIVWD